VKVRSSWCLPLGAEIRLMTSKRHGSIGCSTPSHGSPVDFGRQNELRLKASVPRWLVAQMSFVDRRDCNRGGQNDAMSLEHEDSLFHFNLACRLRLTLTLCSVGHILSHHDEAHSPSHCNTANLSGGKMASTRFLGGEKTRYDPVHYSLSHRPTTSI